MGRAGRGVAEKQIELTLYAIEALDGELGGIGQPSYSSYESVSLSRRYRST